MKIEDYVHVCTNITIASLTGLRSRYDSCYMVVSPLGRCLGLVCSYNGLVCITLASKILKTLCAVGSGRYQDLVRDKLLQVSRIP